MFEAAVDRFGGSVAGAGPVEVGQHVDCTLGQGPSEGDELGQRVWDAGAEGLDQRAHEVASPGAVGFAVGGDYPLVGAPGRLDFDVDVGLEQGVQALALLLGEQVRAGDVLASFDRPGTS